MQYVLVTGGAGSIGSNSVHYLLKAEPDGQIVNPDAFTYPDWKTNTHNTMDRLFP